MLDLYQAMLSSHFVRWCSVALHWQVDRCAREVLMLVRIVDSDKSALLSKSMDV